MIKEAEFRIKEKEYQEIKTLILLGLFNSRPKQAQDPLKCFAKHGLFDKELVKNHLLPFLKPKPDFQRVLLCKQNITY